MRNEKQAYVLLHPFMLFQWVGSPSVNAFGFCNSFRWGQGHWMMKQTIIIVVTIATTTTIRMTILMHTHRVGLFFHFLRELMWDVINCYFAKWLENFKVFSDHPAHKDCHPIN